MYLAYDRIAMFCKNNRDLRITFDTNIRSRRYDLKLENGDHGEAADGPRAMVNGSKGGENDPALAVENAVGTPNVSNKLLEVRQRIQKNAK